MYACVRVCARDTNKDGYSNKHCSLVLLLVKTPVGTFSHMITGCGITAFFASKCHIFVGKYRT